MTDRVLSRRELNRAILERQHLLRRERRPAIEVIERLVGMQAQEPGDPYVALWSRIEGFDPAELSSLIESRRAARVVTLLRTTIHLVSAADALVLRPLLQPVAARQFGYSPFARSLADLDIDEVLAAGRELLSGGPRTINEIGRHLGERWPEHDRTALGYAVRFLVPMVQLPPRGLWGRRGPALLDTVEHWLGAPLEARPSIDDLVLRYLAAFGPASARDVQVWSWLSGIREVVERLRPRLRTFRDERGRELFDVPDGPLPDPDTPAPVRFLPTYDNLYLSHDDRSRVADPALRERPYLRGSVSVDGFLAGTWRLDTKGGAASLRIGLYTDLADPDLTEVETEATALLAFLGSAAERRTMSFERLVA